MNQLKKLIEHNNYKTFKELLQSNINLLQKITINKLLNLSFILYNKGNKIQIKNIFTLLDNNSDPNIKLHFVEENKKINENFKKEKNPLNNEINPLMYSCLKGDLDLFKKLMEKNCDLLQKDKDGNFCINYIFINFNSLNNNKEKENNENNDNIETKNKIEILNTILSKSQININHINQISGNTFLMESIILKSLELTKIFLNEKEIDINIQNSINGNSALHFACIINNKEIIELLLNKEIDATLKNKDGLTAIDIFSKDYSSTEIYSLLVEKYNFQIEKTQKIENEKIQHDKKNEEINSIKNFIHFYNINNNNFSTRLEIPFSFKNNQINNNNNILNDSLSNDGSVTTATETNENNNNNNSNNNNNNNNIVISSNNFSNYLNFEEIPSLFLDISDEYNEDKLTLESLLMEEEKLSFELQSIENEIENKLSENNKYYKELQKYIIENNSIKEKIKIINQNIEENENNNNKEIIALTNKFEMEKLFEKSLIAKQKLIENISNNNNNNNNNKFLILNKKFLIESFDENYIYSQLTKDILAFQKYTNNQMFQNNNLNMSIIN
jgi:ankyrin repeat protein